MNSRRLHRGIALLACLTSLAHAQQTAPNNQERVAARLLALAADNPRLELERVEHAQTQSIDRGSVEGLDLSEVEALELPPLLLPDTRKGGDNPPGVRRP